MSRWENVSMGKCLWPTLRTLIVFLPSKEMQIDPEKMSARESEITALQHQLSDLTQLKTALEEKTHDLEVKTRETEEIQAELTRVKEQLVAGGDIQTKGDQTDSMNFELMLKEKEMELERVQTEFAEFRKELQVLSRHFLLQSMLVYPCILEVGRFRKMASEIQYG